MPRITGRGILTYEVPGYSGEHHMINLDAPKRGVVHNFTGPGTRIRERLQRGDKPINSVDACSMKHDIAYMNAPTGMNRQEYIVKADKEFLECLEGNKDAPITAAVVKKMMQLKMKAESMGLLPTGVFSGAGVKDITPPTFLLKRDMKKSVPILEIIVFLLSKMGGDKKQNEYILNLPHAKQVEILHELLI